ncbi:MAG: hypothetical protein J5953_03825 [Prevotella sp.]|nr:hypothetical protein [Prevotella sp.]MBO5631050.1 hypothetical protein [Aeriscardovia sp.]MBO6205002.1 hypothetical protein [Selenomonas sp.]
MKERIKYAVARWSLWLSVAAFVVFVVALLSAAYNVVLWAGAVSLVSFCALMGVSFFYTSDELNRNYVNHCKR